MSLKKERPQYSCNFDKCVKAFEVFYRCKTTKKRRSSFAPALLDNRNALGFRAVRAGHDAVSGLLKPAAPSRYYLTGPVLH